MEENANYADDLSGFDYILNVEIDKEKNKRDKNKFDIYEEYELLLNKKKKRRNENIHNNNYNNNNNNKRGNYGNNESFLLSHFHKGIIDNKFSNNYIFNDYIFLREYVYKNNLLNDDIFFKKEETIIQKRKERKKLLNSNEDISDFIKIYDCNNNYPPMYIQKRKDDKTNNINHDNVNTCVETQSEEHTSGHNNFLRKNNKDFRKLLEELLIQIKEEDKIISELKRKKEQEKKNEEEKFKEEILKEEKLKEENLTDIEEKRKKQTNNYHHNNNNINVEDKSKYDIIKNKLKESNPNMYNNTFSSNMNRGKKKKNDHDNDDDNDDNNNNKKMNKNINFVEKYRAKYFSELLTDESINLEVLLWLKKWNDKIRNEKNINTYNDIKTEQVIKDNDFERVLLLGGSSGKGKTTLAYVIANHFKFNIIEINGSDDRNKETLIPFIESVVCINSVTSKPNLCIIDEIDGLSSTHQNIDSIMKFLNKKDKKNKSIIKRPIICICNDIYHKSLKELRKISKVVIVENINIEMLKIRINYICDKENIKINNEAINKLIDICKSDIRSILNTIYFLSIGSRNTTHVQNNNSISTFGEPKENKGKYIIGYQNITSTQNNAYTTTNINNIYDDSSKNKKVVIINIELLNSYLFYKDANNNYIELLNMIYVKNKNKKITKKLLQDCHDFFYINLANEYNYTQSYYYIYDNLLNIPFNDFDFCKLSYCLDFLCFCDNIEYEQKNILNYSLQKTLYYVVYLFIITIHLNTNSHIQYILINNSHSNYFQRKKNQVQKIKDNFVNEQFGVITYKYIYSKHFFSEIINYLFSFFYMNEFFFKNVHLWGKYSYYNDLDLPKYILVPYEYKNINKFKTFCIKLLYIMTLFNISFTNISISATSSNGFSNNTITNNINQNQNINKNINKNINTNQNINQNININTYTHPNYNEKFNSYKNSSKDKLYIFDPFVDDILIFADKKIHLFSNSQNINSKYIPPNVITNTFHFRTLTNFLNTQVCESLNELKKWVNNTSIQIHNKKNLMDHMQIIKAHKKNNLNNHNNLNKSTFEVTYCPNFHISLTDMILIAYQNSYTKSFQTYFEHEQNNQNNTKPINKDDQEKQFNVQHNILKTKVLFNKQHTNLTISDLVTQEKQYMKDTINKDIQLYFAGRYVKTKGSYRNIEERCNAVLQPLNFYIYKID
ncbi:replication factor c protein, putative [Plasmodium reichenowi]|uniref:Replication factor c protein, putative n=1 Tax=Plasmodium reichenowi TaxID=5854 RepID=A0A2P9D1S7_PLARE|nr:replication factor c protein, putative [Plasmodium reichenowi]